MPFTFSAYRDLVAYLGVSDSYVELNELAVRAFVKGAKASPDAEEYVSAHVKEFGIRVNSTSFAALSNRVAHLYILSVYQALDQFLYEFRREHVELHEKPWSNQGESDPLTWVFDNACGSITKEDEKRWETYLWVVDYYRAVRNKFMHPSKVAPPDALLESVTADMRESVRLEFHTRTAPNAPTQLEIDDFFLFTKALKALGLLFCKVGRPSEARVAQLLARKRFRKFLQSPQRLESALRREAESRFGLRGSEADAVVELSKVQVAH